MTAQCLCIFMEHFCSYKGESDDPYVCIQASKCFKLFIFYGNSMDGSFVGCLGDPLF